MKDKYILEIYYPTSGGGTNTAHFKSDTPFQAINQGDVIDTSEFPDADKTGDLRVASVTHLVWTPPKTDESLHKIRVTADLPHAGRKEQATMLHKIIEGHSAEQMNEYIQPLLDEGWVLHGNLSVITYPRKPPIDLDSDLDSARFVDYHMNPQRTIYIQALIKEETPEETDARVNYLENLLLKPIDQLTPEERKTREDYLEDAYENEDADPS